MHDAYCQQVWFTTTYFNDLNCSWTQVFINCTLFYRYIRENLSMSRIYELLSTDTLTECLGEASATPSVSHYRYHQRL